MQWVSLYNCIESIRVSFVQQFYCNQLNSISSPYVVSINTWSFTGNSSLCWSLFSLHLNGFISLWSWHIFMEERVSFYSWFQFWNSKTYFLFIISVYLIYHHLMWKHIIKLCLAQSNSVESHHASYYLNWCWK